MQETGIQDESIRELSGTLREMLATANDVPELRVIPNTTNVLEQIGRQSLQVASLIHEYTKLPWEGNLIPLLDPVKSDNDWFVARTVMPHDLKSRIDVCGKRCATLKDLFDRRLQLDTNAQAKEIKTDLRQIGTFLPRDGELSLK